jgi:RNA polymerase sigma-70 factor (ECF subfamily)
MVEYVYKEYILKYSSYIDNVTEKEIDKNLLEEYIDRLIQKLPPARKQVFIMSRKEMLSNKEIAERLHISESSVHTAESDFYSRFFYFKLFLIRYKSTIYIVFPTKTIIQKIPLIFYPLSTHFFNRICLFEKKVFTLPNL